MPETSAKPRRRWFAFSLRTLLVVVTALCCWVGYEFHWIRQRHEVTAKYAAINRRLVDRVIVLGDSNPTAPWPLCWLGENGHAFVAIEANSSEAEADRVRKLFPESQIFADTDFEVSPAAEAD